MHPLTAERLAACGFPGEMKRTKHRHIVSMFGPIMANHYNFDTTAPQHQGGVHLDKLEFVFAVHTGLRIATSRMFEGEAELMAPVLLFPFVLF